jgi:hypothetical protein
VREVLGLDPLYDTKRLRSELAWAEAHQAMTRDTGIDWDSDHQQIVAEDGTPTISMRDRISGQARRMMRQREGRRNGSEDSAP